MWFAKRRSSLAAESAHTESEPRRRNRLSKPPTGRIPSGVSTSSLKAQASLPQSKNASRTELSIPSSPASGKGIQQQKSRDSVIATDSGSPLRTHKNDSGFRVAYMVSQLEGKAAGAGTSPSRTMQQRTPPPQSPIKPPKRKSLLLRRLSLQRSSSITRTPSSERINPLECDTAVFSTPDSAMDRILEPQPIPPMRRSSFAPGTATRKPSQIAGRQESQGRDPIQEIEERQTIAFDIDDFDWQPPPPPRTTGRAGTPSDISYSHLAGLRHGSLQIVNGRASPAFSEVSKVSKHLLSAPAPRRDVSSDYGDADEEFDLLVSASGNTSHLEPSPPTGNAECRYFSWEHNDDRAGPRIHPLHSVMTAQEETHLISASTPADDHTSLMAQEYIAELGVGPFDQQQSSSPVGTIRRTRSEGSLWRASRCSSLQKTPPLNNDPEFPSPVSTPERSPSPSWSVVRKSSFRSEESRGRQTLRENEASDESRPCDSPMSWHSPIEPRYSLDEGFQSAVEFQPQLSNPSLAIPSSRAPQKSDSGYSSSNSLRSFQMARPTPSPTKFRALPEVPDSQVNVDVQESGRVPSFSEPGISILKSRRSEPYVSTFSNLQPNPVASAPMPIVPTTTAPESDPRPTNGTKARKKLLKKRRPSSQPPGQVALVRVRSFELDNIPHVSQEAQENLRKRSYAVPELDQTYSSMGNRANSNSTLFLPLNEVRFPSPAPEQVLHAKRPRSRSRRRSWFGRSKEEKAESRNPSGVSQAEALALVNDVGTASTSFPTGHYNLTDGPRPIKEDKTAAELSRPRTRSRRDRDSTISDRRSSFNDRGGLPGKNLRPASFASDAPPITPEMVQKAYRTSSIQRQPSMGNEAGPPPPLHSPRPAYIDYQGNHSGPMAPPPPSHSPRPIDISPDPWVAQAAVWKARRLSAGEGLRQQSWGLRQHEPYYEEVADELLYPVIPPQQGGQHHDWQQSLPPEDYSSSSQDYYDGCHNSSQYQQQRYPSNAFSYDASHDAEFAYVRQTRKISRTHDHQQSRGQSAQWRGPSGGGYSSCPVSYANSVRSFASSLAEDLHPADFERQHPPSTFGRYSGGLDYGTQRGNGCRGSAGTRSMSGKAEAAWKGVSLRTRAGVDLGDGLMARGRA
ncbi:hypothetical protein AYO20_09210 [Fonsecaea nubica]|uniref:Uncharacterized protein n=1 Tax=Fonsecaea nubica TaxID=856822 RepID=A0A178CK90_9EURO|nr:hypothetical protein AYO20_09210 [Fonsecaea nubica]OAL29473.1 hypothetical protein AYO20_09210 [Fonsecaea nubica]